MNFSNYNEMWNTWNADPYIYSPSGWSTNVIWDRRTLDSDMIEMIKEEEPEVKIYSERIPETLTDQCRVVCTKEQDLDKDRILLNLSKIKSQLMMKCAPMRVQSIECKMTPAVKENIIHAYRKIEMYGKKTPFVARFDEYGRRLPDEIKINTLKGMTIKIVDPKDYGDFYLEFTGIIPDEIITNHEDSEFTYKKDDSVFDEDLPF